MTKLVLRTFANDDYQRGGIRETEGEDKTAWPRLNLFICLSVPVFL